MSIAKGDGGLEMAHYVAKSTLGIMQADGDSLSDEGAKCGLYTLIHGSTINLNFKYRARRADTIRI